MTIGKDQLLLMLLKQRNIDPVTGCWLWTGATRDADGPYGRIRIAGRNYYVHRISAHIFHDLDLEDQKTRPLHSCDNPPCFNPDHLKLGTQAQNLADMREKGRDVPPRGTRNARAELTEEIVRLVRQQRAEGVRNIDIAESLSISKSKVADIVTGRSWAWLQ